MSTSPSNLKLALDAYEAQQRRQAALVEAQRIGTLIHIQEQHLLAAKYLAKQRKSQRRRAHANNNANANSQATTPPTPTLTVEDATSECAIEEEEEEDLFEPVTAAPAAAPICPSLAARRAARSASKRGSSFLQPMHPVLESIPEPDTELTGSGGSDAGAHSASHSASTSSHSLSNNSSTMDIIPVQRFVSHKRRPQEPFASLASRSQWKPDSLARVCDNTLCKKPFSLFGNQSRHHCRRCGNVFCAACLTQTEVLYDMERSQWDAFPEALLASIFDPETDTNQDQRASSPSPSPSPSPSCESRSESRRGAIPTSPASTTSTNLSSSVESGSSRASTSSSSYFPTTTTGKQHANSSSSHLRPPITDPLHTVHREPTWCTGTNAILPSPIPSSWRDALLDIASEEKVCEECHDELWDLPTPVERAVAKRQFAREREEMAWALTVLGLDVWEEILRKVGLTLKGRKESKEGSKERRGSESTTGSSRRSARHHHQQQHQQPVEPQMPTGASGVKPELGLDYLDRPTYPHVYAWVTPPPCIRFTSSAFKPTPSPSADPATTTAPNPSNHSSESTTPSPFGMLKSPAKFLPPPLPAAYLAAQHAASQRALLATVPRGSEREDVRWERYHCAVKELVKAAYRRGVPCDHLDGGVLGVRYLVEPTPLEVVKEEVVKRALDLAARWRGDPVGC